MTTTTPAHLPITTTGHADDHDAPIILHRWTPGRTDRTWCGRVTTACVSVLSNVPTHTCPTCYHDEDDEQ